MIRRLLFTMILALMPALSAHAAIDYGRYPELSPKDVELCQRLEARGIPEATIVDYIEKLIASRQRPPMYIPPHTTADLNALTVWAVGGAFASFASNAGVEFDRVAYLADCPNRALFNFALATGQTYLNQDVTIAYVNMVYRLTRDLSRSPATFHDRYLETIKETPFAKYVISPWPSY
jgi:hypothetical protein